MRAQMPVGGIGTGRLGANRPGANGRGVNGLGAKRSGARSHDERELGAGGQPPSWFESFASRTANFTGRPLSFLLAFLTVFVWAVTGPIFHYSDTWQLVINTGTTIVTFLMVFLIQNTQNRDTVALQLKLDELILATRGARDSLACIEDGSEKDIEVAREQVHVRAEQPDPEHVT